MNEAHSSVLFVHPPDKLLVEICVTTRQEFALLIHARELQISIHVTDAPLKSYGCYDNGINTVIRGGGKGQWF